MHYQNYGGGYLLWLSMEFKYLIDDFTAIMHELEG